MTISIWRYSHFILAIASSLFLLVASVTGVILAIEPISHQTKGYAVQNLDKISLGSTIDALKKNYDDVFAIEIESSGFVKGLCSYSGNGNARYLHRPKYRPGIGPNTRATFYL